MLEVELILRVLISNEGIVSEESKSWEVKRSNESVVVISLGDVVSMGSNGSFTRDEFESGIGFADRSEVISTDSQVELGEVSIRLHIGEEVPWFARESELSEIDMSAEITLSALGKLNSESIFHRELNLALIDDGCLELSVFVDGIDLNLVVELAAVSGGALDLVSLECSVDVVIREYIVGGTKTGERREFQGLSHFFLKKIERYKILLF